MHTFVVLESGLAILESHLSSGYYNGDLSNGGSVLGICIVCFSAANLYTGLLSLLLEMCDDINGRVLFLIQRMSRCQLSVYCVMIESILIGY